MGATTRQPDPAPVPKELKEWARSLRPTIDRIIDEALAERGIVRRGGADR